MSNVLSLAPVLEASAPPVTEYWAEYCQGLAHGSQVAYRTRVRKAANAIGVTVERFLAIFIQDPSRLCGELLEILDGEISASYRYSILVTLSCFGNWLAERGFIDRKPVVRNPRPAHQWTNRKHALALPVVKQIKDKVWAKTGVLGAYERALFVCLTGLALRRGEILSVRCDRRLLIEEDLIRIKPKGAREFIPIKASGKVKGRLLALMEVHARVFGSNPDATDPLFVHPDQLIDLTPGAPKAMSPASLNRLVRKWGRIIGYPSLSPHAFRHYVITKLLDDDTPVSRIAALTRHATAYILEHYCDRRGDHALFAADKALEGVL